jgi:hypothetical protein
MIRDAFGKGAIHVEPVTPVRKDEFMERLETVKQLADSDFETYAVVKDRKSGQHYLHYAFRHINLSEGGRRDEYDHFLPLSSDDVLGILFGEQPYRFPDHWRTPYLRSGNDNRLMPFDPRENHDLDDDARTEQEVFAKLLAYKEAWRESDDPETLTRRLLGEIDRLLKKEE